MGAEASQNTERKCRRDAWKWAVGREEVLIAAATLFPLPFLPPSLPAPSFNILILVIASSSLSLLPSPYYLLCLSSVLDTIYVPLDRPLASHPLFFVIAFAFSLLPDICIFRVSLQFSPRSSIFQPHCAPSSHCRSPPFFASAASQIASMLFHCILSHQLAPRIDLGG